MLLQGGALAALRGVQVSAAGNVTVRADALSITGAFDQHTTSNEHAERKSDFGRDITRFGNGVGAKSTEANARGQTSLARSTFSGANVDLRAVDEQGRRGQLTLGGITVDTSGTLTVEASQLVMAAQTTKVDESHTSQGKDWFWQRAQGEGGSDTTANYAHITAGKIVTDVDSATVETGAKDSVDALAKQPGMGWVDQLRNDPALAGKVDWKQIDDAYKGWDYKKEGLTPEGAGIVVAVVTYLTWGEASGAGAVVGEAVGGGMAGVVASGAVAAGVTTLASQAAVAIINNQGNLGHTLHDLGSSQSVKSLLSVMALGGALGAMNMNPTGQPTVGEGAQGFMDQ
ncbi:MAG TPA: DUF637 domain-containing protein, partial [Variovorax sp.]|nr:DUF637 domain-containing protein [Variovorax sp.]